MTARAKCDKCKKKRWTRIRAGRGYCDECLKQRKLRRRGGKGRKRHS